MKKQDIEDLRELIEFLKQHQVAEFDVDRGDLKIRLKFNPQESASAGLGDLARLLRAAPAGHGAGCAGCGATGIGAAGVCCTHRPRSRVALREVADRGHVL